MGAAPSVHVMQDGLGSQFESQPAPLIDQSVFFDSLDMVMAGIMYWHTSRQPGEARRSPFNQWQACGSPVDDMSWIVLGYNFERHDYYGDVYEYTMNDDGMTITRARHLLKRVCDTRIPEHALHVAEVVCQVLNCLIHEVFPAGPLIAHHWMIDGDFTEKDGWAVPNYIQGRWPYSQPGRDFMDGVERVLRSVGEPNHRVAPVTGVPLQMPFIIGQRDRNLQAVRDAFPRLLDRDFKFPKGLVPFWKDGIMDSYFLWSESMAKFSDDELAKAPGSSNWYVVYGNLFLEYFIVFQRETDPSTGKPTVTSWKLDGQLEDMIDGDRVYDVNAKLRVHYGFDDEWDCTWMTFLKETWTPCHSLVCGSPDTPLKYPMVLDLVAERRPGQAPRRNQMIRCTTVPDNIHQAVLYTGRGRRDSFSGTWVPLAKEY